MDEGNLTTQIATLPLPELAAPDVSLRNEPAGAGPTRSLNHHFRLTCHAEGRSLDRDAMRRSLIALHAPLVDALFARAKLARRAMWRASSSWSP